MGAGRAAPLASAASVLNTRDGEKCILESGLQDVLRFPEESRVAEIALEYTTGSVLKPVYIRLVLKTDCIPSHPDLHSARCNDKLRSLL